MAWSFHHHSRFLVFGIRTSSKAFFSACPIWINEKRNLYRFFREKFPQKVTPAFQVTPCFIGHSSCIDLDAIKIYQNIYPNESSNQFARSILLEDQLQIGGLTLLCLQPSALLVYVRMNSEPISKQNPRKPPWILGSCSGAYPNQLPG